MSQPTVLLWSAGSAPWREKLPALCTIQGLRLRTLSPADLDLPLARLAAGEWAEGEAGAPLPEPLLLFCHLNSAQLDRLLPALRKAGVPRTCLKAVLTPHNASWTLRALYEELCKEREAMTGQGS